MRVGTIIKWEEFPLQDDDVIKARYFLYLGKTVWGECPVLFHLAYATTKIHHYQSGNRSDHQVLKFDAGTFGFPQDTILDLDWQESVSENLFNQNTENIEEVSSLDKETLICIWDKISKSNYLSRKIKIDIHSSLNQLGITGLKKP